MLVFQGSGAGYQKDGAGYQKDGAGYQKDGAYQKTPAQVTDKKSHLRHDRKVHNKQSYHPMPSQKDKLLIIDFIS